MLVGINHNLKTVTFGCALVVHENEALFIWILEQLVEAGDRQKPETTVTDGAKLCPMQLRWYFQKHGIDCVYGI